MFFKVDINWNNNIGNNIASDKKDAKGNPIYTDKTPSANLNYVALNIALYF